MKIVQVNAWCGRLNGPLAAFIKKEEPDILCMQEAFEPNSKPIPPFGDQYGFTDEIMNVGKFSDVFFSAAWGFEMGGEIINIGNLVLSKYTLSGFQAVHINNGYHIKQAANEGLPNTRVWQACSAKLPEGKILSISNYHGYLAGSHGMGDEATTKTLYKVRDLLSKLAQPLIFCADLNISPESPSIHALDDLKLINLARSTWDKDYS